MKKKLFLLVLSLCVIVGSACALMPAAAEVETTKEPTKTFNIALESRFTNMLNRNYSYNSDFESADIITDNSIIALLDKREEGSDYISDEIVKGFVQDMYGIEIIDIHDEADMHKDGFVYITPRGFTTYKHTVTDIKENEDGSFTVFSDVIINPHDDDEIVTTAETLFVVNEDSAFGYNIIYSDLECAASGI